MPIEITRTERQESHGLSGEGRIYGENSVQQSGFRSQVADSYPLTIRPARDDLTRNQYVFEGEEGPPNGRVSALEPFWSSSFTYWLNEIGSSQ